MNRPYPLTAVFTPPKIIIFNRIIIPVSPVNLDQGGLPDLVGLVNQPVEGHNQADP
jgi:hypothetical protein